MRERNLDVRYEILVKRLADAGLKVDFTKEYYALHRKDYKFPVECMNCRTKFMSSIGNNHYNKCPICSGTNAFTEDALRLKSDVYAKENNLTVLKYPENLCKSEATVKCTICGTVYKTPLRKTNTCKCPMCFKSNSKRTIYERFKSYADANSIEMLFDKEFITKAREIDGTAVYYPVKCKVCGTEFKSLFIKSTVPTCPKCFRGRQRSHIEEDLAKWIESKGIEVYRNYRKTCLSATNRAYEVDLYIPSMNVGIEINGLFWHSYPRKPKFYHRDKIDSLLSIGMKCYSFWENTSLGLIKSVIGSKLGILRKVHARKCMLSEGDTHEFFERNHIDGDCKGMKTFYLTQEGEIVASLKLRTHKEGAEIARFACKRGLVVVGGYSRLLKVSVKYLKSLGYNKLITYCNRDLSPDPKDNFYANHGFKFVGDSGPIMKYFVNKNLEFAEKGLYSRQRFQKHLLLKYTNKLSYSGSEIELAVSLGILPVYNSGNFKYEMCI